MIDPITASALGGLGVALFGWLSSRNKKYVDQLSIAVQQINQLTNRVDSQEAKLIRKEERITILEEKFSQAVKERDSLSSRVEELLTQLHDTNEILISFKKELKDSLIKLKEAEEIINNFQKDRDDVIKNLSSRIQGLENDNYSHPRI